MERMVRLYEAPSEYMALSVHEALNAAGVPCLLFSNEIPMEPGFNFGADYAYASLFVNAEDATQARELLQDTREMMCAGDHGAETAYPRRIDLRGYHWLAWVLLSSWCIFLAPYLAPYRSLQQSIKRMNDLGHAADPSVWLAFVLFTFLNLMFLSGLIYANWDMVKRTAWSIAAGLLGLLALPFWLGYELLRWLWDKLAHMAMLNP